MIGLKEACKKVLEKNPNMYITDVNDLGEFYEFILMFNGRKWTYYMNPFMVPRAIVYKQTGIYETTDLDSRKFEYDESTTHYSQQQIEKLLSETA